jgi:hypothetical protein
VSQASAPQRQGCRLARSATDKTAPRAPPAGIGNHTAIGQMHGDIGAVDTVSVTPGVLVRDLTVNVSSDPCRSG